jgi:hypothetical protein
MRHTDAPPERGATEAAPTFAGEIWTSLLQQSGRPAAGVVDEVLALRHGERVRTSERPMPCSVSPDIPTGVDCRLPTSTGAKARGIGTTLSRARIVGGRVVQGSTYVWVVRASERRRRMPWSYHLANLGVVEASGAVGDEALAEGLTGERSPAGALDLGAPSRRLISAVQCSPLLDRRPPFRAGRTRLRWAATLSEAPRAANSARFTVTGENGRTVRLSLGRDELPAALAFCEDLAYHDWLLTTMRRALSRGDDDTLVRQRPLLEHLFDLWMPGALTPLALLDLWEGFERDPGFTWHWQSLTARVRDRCTLRMLSLLETTPAAEDGRRGAGQFRG